MGKFLPALIKKMEWSVSMMTQKNSTHQQHWNVLSMRFVPLILHCVKFVTCFPSCPPGHIVLCRVSDGEVYRAWSQNSGNGWEIPCEPCIYQKATMWNYWRWYCTGTCNEWSGIFYIHHVKWVALHDYPMYITAYPPTGVKTYYVSHL